LGYIGVQVALALEGSSVLTFAGRRLCGEAVIPAWPIQAISDRLSCFTDAILHPFCRGISAAGPVCWASLLAALSLASNKLFFFNNIRNYFHVLVRASFPPHEVFTSEKYRQPPDCL
jgi:hypothetical protein